MKNRVATLAGSLLALLLIAGGAAAHAFLDSAVPAVGGTVRAAPERVTLRFTEPLEPAFSRIQVVDSAGRPVDKGDGKVDPKDPKQLAVSLPPLGPGAYKVVWRAVSLDTHATNGDYGFVVSP